jgi:hypothetical protein
MMPRLERRAGITVPSAAMSVSEVLPVMVGKRPTLGWLRVVDSRSSTVRTGSSRSRWPAVPHANQRSGA